MKINKLIITTLLAISGIAGFALSKNNQIIDTHAAVGNYSVPASTYYKNITATGGKQLLAQLHDLMVNTHKTYTNYNDSGKNGYQKNTDQYYNEDESAKTGYIREFYTGLAWDNLWGYGGDYGSAGKPGCYNREHVWCQNNSNGLWGENGGGGDMHHLRPTEKTLNSTRSDNKFGEISNRDNYKKYAEDSNGAEVYHGGYLSGEVFEPLDSVKGDVARILFYTYTHYNTKTNSIFGGYATADESANSSYYGTLNFTHNVSGSESAAIQMLLEWHNDDPVDFMESKRNEQVAIYQGNRNPFIDNHDYANLIWGTGTPTTPTLSSISVSGQKTQFTVGDTFTFGGTVTAIYNDDTTKNVTDDATFTGYNMSQAGTQTVTVSYLGKTTTYQIYVSNQSGGSQTTDTVTVSTTIVDYANSNDWQNSVQYTTINLDSNITLTANGGGNTGKYYTSGNNWRLYQGENATLSITAANNCKITSIKITYSTSNSGILLYGDSEVNSGTTVSIDNLDSVIFSVGNTGSATNGQVRITDISITYSSPSSGGSVEPEIPVEPTLSSISVSGQKTQFTVGDTFTFGGTVTARYSDDTTKNVTDDAEFSGYNMSLAGTQTVTVSYLGKTTTYQITVEEAEVEEPPVPEVNTNGTLVVDEKPTPASKLGNGKYLFGIYDYDTNTTFNFMDPSKSTATIEETGITNFETNRDSYASYYFSVTINGTSAQIYADGTCQGKSYDKYYLNPNSNTSFKLEDSASDWSYQTNKVYGGTDDNGVLFYSDTRGIMHRNSGNTFRNYATSNITNSDYSSLYLYRVDTAFNFLIKKLSIATCSDMLTKEFVDRIQYLYSKLSSEEISLMSTTTYVGADKNTYTMESGYQYVMQRYLSTGNDLYNLQMKIANNVDILFVITLSIMSVSLIVVFSFKKKKRV